MPPESRSGRNTSPWARVASLIALFAIGTGCGSFFGGPEPSGLGTNPISDACTWETVASDCFSNEYCDAKDCKSVGRCVERPPPLGSGDAAWACGCDGISYWNATFAKAQGVTAPTSGFCGAPGSSGSITPAPPLACSSSKACPTGTVCLEGRGDCKANGTGQGTCWAWPNDFVCKAGAQLGFKRCDGMGGCLSECGAITSMKAYVLTTVDCR